MYWIGYLILISLLLFITVFSFSKAAAWQQDITDQVLRCSISTSARVVETAQETVVNKWSGIRSVRFYLVIRFMIQDKEFRVCCKERWHSLPLEIGDKLTIWYNPCDPEDFHLDGKPYRRIRNYFIPRAIGLISGVSAVGCAAFCFAYIF